MDTRKLTEVPQAEFLKETNFVVEIDEELKRVPSAMIRQLVTDEAERAESAEQILEHNLVLETSRAEGEERELTTNLNEEIARAQTVENGISADLASEIARAQNSESALTEDLSAEIRRAENQETELQGSIKAEVTRAQAAEKTLTDNLSVEVSRAKSKETELQGNIDAHTASVDGEIQAMKAADAALEGKKADTSYVDAELGKRYTKDQVYTRAEMLEKIEELIGTAPETLDTFMEIADALGNDPNFATTIMNALAGKVDKVTGKQLSTNDYTAAEKSKLTGIAAGAEVNVQADWNVTDTASDAHIKGKPTTFTPSAHSHTKSQITDMPTKLSQLTNDQGYITQEEVDTSQNHTHSNKTVLDKITQALLDKWNSALTFLPAHKHVKADVTDFPSSLPANGGNSATVNGHSVGTDVPAGAKFTDTTYAHPNSGAAAGTYRSVTVNTQGHVTGGTNPTTLAGYGITDAASSSHGHPASSITEDSNHRFITDACKMITDWNSAVTTGFYMASEAANAPSATWYTGQVIAHNTNYVYQEVYAFTASAEAKAVPKYIRCKTHGTWGAWAEGAHAKSIHRTLTLTSGGWSGSYPYTQTLNVAGVTAGDDIKIVGLYVPTGAAQAQVTAWTKAAGLLMHNPGGAAAGQVTFKAYKRPAVDFQIITEGG